MYYHIYIIIKLNLMNILDLLCDVILEYKFSFIDLSINLYRY